ncbi:MAG: flagellar biosynthetic protein FliO [Acidobacteriaceae bacterium]
MDGMRENARGGGAREPGSGLASWLLAWFQTPLRVRFSGIGKARAKRRMELVEMLQLGGKRQLMLVVCDGQRYLVGAGGDSVQSIAEMREPLAADYVSIAMSEGTDTGRENAAMQDSEQEARCSC